MLFNFCFAIFFLISYFYYYSNILDSIFFIVIFDIEVFYFNLDFLHTQCGPNNCIRPLVEHRAPCLVTIDLLFSLARLSLSSSFRRLLCLFPFRSIRFSDDKNVLKDYFTDLDSFLLLSLYFYWSYFYLVCTYIYTPFYIYVF